MKSHAPDDYQNPFIRIVQGVDDDVTLSKRSDVFYQDATLTAFISAGRPPNIPFSTLVVPNTPFENLYEMPDDVLCAVHRFAKRLALALKGQFGCEGVSLQQHNEPAGGQDVWHYHLYVMPRYTGDLFHVENWRWLETTPTERAPFAEKLRQYFDS